MARAEKQQQSPFHPALPPAQRTVGQLVGEAIRAYGGHFWKALALGIPVVVANALVWKSPSNDQRLALLPLTALLISLSYVAAVALVMGAPLRRRSTLVAYVVAVLVFLPVPILAVFYILPALAWLAFLGLAVPAALNARSVASPSVGSSACATRCAEFSTPRRPRKATSVAKQGDRSCTGT